MQANAISREFGCLDLFIRGTHKNVKDSQDIKKKFLNDGQKVRKGFQINRIAPAETEEMRSLLFEKKKRQLLNKYYTGATKFFPEKLDVLDKLTSRRVTPNQIPPLRTKGIIIQDESSNDMDLSEKDGAGSSRRRRKSPMARKSEQPQIASYARPIQKSPNTIEYMTMDVTKLEDRSVNYMDKLKHLKEARQK